MLSYTSATVTTDFETATHYIKRQHKPTPISATHVSIYAQRAFSLPRHQTGALHEHHRSFMPT